RRHTRSDRDWSSDVCSSDLLIVEIANDLAEKGVTEDELERAKKPILTSLRESARTNGYWLGSVVSRVQERPEQLDWCRTRYADRSEERRVGKERRPRWGPDE